MSAKPLGGETMTNEQWLREEDDEALSLPVDQVRETR